MAAQTATIEGILNFSNLTKTDVYNGQDTEKFSVTITMDEDTAATLAAQGVKIKDYKGNKQRKFSTKFETFKRVDAEDNPYKGEIPYNSKVRVAYELGNTHPIHGVSTYLKAVRVLEEAEMTEGDYGDF